MARSSALVLVLAVAACGRDMAPLATTTLQVGPSTIRAEVARQALDRHRGLSGRPALEPGWGMLFVVDGPRRPTFRMRDMMFDLDLVWIREERIVAITHGVSAAPDGVGRAYPAPEPVDHVLEVPAGTADASGWRVGMPVRTAGGAPLQDR